MAASREDWERVGHLLAERRVQISPRYANRRAFADETGVNWRTLYDAEYGKRATFGRGTIRAFETAYQLVPGSLDRTLAGGPLEPADVPRPVIAVEGALEAELIAKILRRLSPEDQAVIRYIMRMTDGEGRPWSQERKLQEIDKYVDSVDGSGQARPAAGLPPPFLHVQMHNSRNIP